MSDEPVAKIGRDFDSLTSKVLIRIVKQTPEELDRKRAYAEANGMPNTVDYEDD